MEYEEQTHQALSRIQRRVIEVQVHQTRVELMVLLSKILTDVLVVQANLSAQPAASSPQKPEEPSAESTCESTESAPRSERKTTCPTCNRYVGEFSQALAPRKVWLVGNKGWVCGVYSSLDQARSYVAKQEPAWRDRLFIAGHKVADG